MTEPRYTGKGTDFYLGSESTAKIVNLAIDLKRPILVEGEPGCGKATGQTNREHVRSARRFIDLARDASWWPIAWLNPMPRRRWVGTSAARIAAIPGIAMFELTEDGLVAAVDHLRGKGGR
jgi:hypothetical protein